MGKRLQVALDDTTVEELERERGESGLSLNLIVRAVMGRWARQRINKRRQQAESTVDNREA